MWGILLGQPDDKGQASGKGAFWSAGPSVTAPGRYADGNGLYLIVDPSGAKRWMLRTIVQGKRRDIGLGGCKLVSLAEAREMALTFRKIAREGGDPLAERRKQRMVIPTFEHAARSVHAEHLPTWTNRKHGVQWINTLSHYVFPILGNQPVDKIETSDVLKVLSPIWLIKPETARRVRQRIGTVLDWAKAAGFRTGDNPVDGVSKGLPKQANGDEHHAALPFSNVPDFIIRLRASDATETTRLAFEFLILTATRTSEVLGAKWCEIDIGSKTWTIPADRMKAKRLYKVPLADRALEILDRCKILAGDSEYVFPGRSNKKPLCNTVFLMALRRMGIAATAHGFRSAFRDWGSERTNFPREVCEQALAHTIKDKTEAAYRRGDLLDKRRELTAAWNAFLVSRPSS
jgi:integrase